MSTRPKPTPSIRRLAGDLAERLRAAMPAGAEIAVEPDASISLALGEQGTTVGFGALAAEGGEGALETAVRQVLSSAQDVVAEERAEPWPGWAEGELALPEVRVGEGEIALWFGPEGRPTLAFDPIPLPGR